MKEEKLKIRAKKRIVEQSFSWFEGYRHIDQRFEYNTKKRSNYTTRNPQIDTKQT